MPNSDLILSSDDFVEDVLSDTTGIERSTADQHHIHHAPQAPNITLQAMGVSRYYLRAASETIHPL